MWTKVLSWWPLITSLASAYAVWHVTSGYYELKIKDERTQAQTAVIEQCNVRILSDAAKCQKLQSDNVVIRSHAYAMSQRVQAECGTLHNPSTNTATTRYGLYGADGLFLIELAARCAENLAACKK